MKEQTINIDNHFINLRKWEVLDSTANIYVAHGLGEHGGRYEDFALHFNQLGFNVYAHDHRGHGKSSGTRGHINSFSVYSDDLKKVIEMTSQTDSINYLLGHSLGGVIASGFLLRYPSIITKTVISAPGFEKKIQPNAIKAGMGKLLANIFPKLTLWNEIDAEWICSSKEVVETYKNDPLVHDRVSAKFFTSFLAEFKNIKNNFSKISNPLLMLIPGSDIIVNHEVSKSLFRSLNSKNSKLVEYSNSYHELLNEEKTRLLAYVEIESWLQNK
ncbi:MAG: alpha-beta hydrolase superfamily lysophospholipase [Saprospiraceae bacterium]|jgi:alpha-beta hydrolase superfamily lysophospholipase